MAQTVTFESRGALERARLFLEKASRCSADERIDFEAYLEAAIVFGRAAMHRFRKKHRRHPEFGSWWESLFTTPAAQFFYRERNWILKDASMRVGQKVWLSGVAGNMSGAEIPPSPEAYQPLLATESYFFEDSETPATATVGKHLAALEAILGEAERRFSGDETPENV